MRGRATKQISLHPARFLYRWRVKNLGIVEREEETPHMKKQWLVKGLGIGVLATAFAFGQAQERALTRGAQDPQHQWGPCPAFMPAGCGLAVLNGDPAKPNADVFLRLPAKATVPEHWHTSAERMVLVAGRSPFATRVSRKSCSGPGCTPTGPPRSHTPHPVGATHPASCSSLLNRLWTPFRSRRPRSSARFASAWGPVQVWVGDRVTESESDRSDARAR